MSTPKCEMCGRDIPNAKNRQKFCPDCSKKRHHDLRGGDVNYAKF